MKALYALALVATAAVAQSGVALTTPATASAADQARFAELSKQANVVSITPVKINPSALESNVISLTLDGKDYRFTGQKRAPSSEPIQQGDTLKPSTVETWTGTAGPDTFAVFSRDGNNVFGLIRLQDQGYELIKGGLVKTRPEVGDSTTMKKAKP